MPAEANKLSLITSFLYASGSRQRDAAPHAIDLLPASLPVSSLGVLSFYTLPRPLGRGAPARGGEGSPFSIYITFVLFPYFDFYIISVYIFSRA